MSYPPNPDQPYGQQPPPGYHPQQPYGPQHSGPQQPYGYGYQQQPPQMPRKVTAVSKQRGLSGMSHMTHLLLTIFTCGMWGVFVWLPWWIFRMIFRKKTKTTYRYQ